MTGARVAVLTRSAGVEAIAAALFPPMEPDDVGLPGNSGASVKRT